MNVSFQMMDFVFKMMKIFINNDDINGISRNTDGDMSEFVEQGFGGNVTANCNINADFS